MTNYETKNKTSIKLSIAFDFVIILALIILMFTLPFTSESYMTTASHICGQLACIVFIVMFSIVAYMDYVYLKMVGIIEEQSDAIECQIKDE